MPKTKAQKKEIFNSLKEKLLKSKSVIFSDYTGIKVQDLENLRKEMKKEKSEFLVAKKTLVELFFKENKQEIPNEALQGGLSLGLGYEDEVAPAKVLAKFIKKDGPGIRFSAGWMEGRFLSKEEVTDLSKLPSKQEIRGILVSQVQAPLRGLVYALQGNLQGLIVILQNYGRKKASA